MRSLNVILIVTALACMGCGRGHAVKEHAKDVSNRAGRLVGEGASSFFTGFGEGVEKTITAYDVRLSDELKGLGISVTIAKHMGRPSTGEDKPSLSLYVLNQSPVNGTLRLRFFNEQGQEIGRAATAVEFKADDARYVAFPLDSEIPLSVVKYLELDLKKN